MSDLLGILLLVILVGLAAAVGLLALAGVVIFACCAVLYRLGGWPLVVVGLAVLVFGVLYGVL